MKQQFTWGVNGPWAVGGEPDHHWGLEQEPIKHFILNSPGFAALADTWVMFPLPCRRLRGHLVAFRAVVSWLEVVYLDYSW